MYSGTYQLVSEHSILSAQRDNRVAAVEKLLEKKAQHSKPEWKEQLDTIKRRLERRRSRCDELTEKDFEIYLEMKLQWLQQYYVTAKSKAPEKKTREPEEDGWNEPDFKVYDRGRGRSEDENSRRRRSREDEFHEKLEEMAEILRSYLSNVAVKSSEPEERRETEELKREKGEIEGSSGVPLNVIAKSQVDEIDGGIEPPLKPAMEENVEQSSPEELKTEESPATATEGGTIKVETASLIDLGEISLSCVTVLCNREKKDEDEESSETALLGESSPEEEDGGATVMEMEEVVCDEEDVILSLWNETRVGKEKKAGADWNSQDLGPVTGLMGQAQSLIVTPPQFTNNRGVLQEKTEMGQKEGVSFNSKAGGLDKTMDPPNTLLVAENKAFDLGDSFSAFGIARSSCFKLWDPGGRLLLIVSSYIFTLRTR